MKYFIELREEPLAATAQLMLEKRASCRALLTMCDAMEPLLTEEGRIQLNVIRQSMGDAGVILQAMYAELAPFAFGQQSPIGPRAVP